MFKRHCALFAPKTKITIRQQKQTADWQMASRAIVPLLVHMCAAGALCNSSGVRMSFSCCGRWTTGESVFPRSQHARKSEAVSFVSELYRLSRGLTLKNQFWEHPSCSFFLQKRKSSVPLTLGGVIVKMTSIETALGIVMLNREIQKRKAMMPVRTMWCQGVVKWRPKFAAHSCTIWKDSPHFVLFERVTIQLNPKGKAAKPIVLDQYSNQ